MSTKATLPSGSPSAGAEAEQYAREIRTETNDLSDKQREAMFREAMLVVYGNGGHSPVPCSR